MNKKLFIALVLWCVSLSAFPLGLIKGKVYDENSRQPLPGATIYIHEFEKGVVTDENGFFTMNDIPSTEINIEVSFLGYETKIIRTNQNDELNIGLKPSMVETPEVVVSASNFSSQHENAVKIEAINLSTLRTVGSPSFAESLATVPGVDVISKGNGIGKPVIRGLSNSNILFLNNGIKMENYQFSEDHPYVIDETGIDRIEIIKGPASLLYGSDAIGGLINILSEHPSISGKTEGDLTVQGYSVSKGYSLNGGIKGTSKQLTWGVRGRLKNHCDYLDGNGIFVPNSRFSQQSAKTFLNWNNSKGYYKLSYEYNHLLPGMTNEASVGLVTKNEYAKTFWYQNLTNHILISKNTFIINKTKVNANASWQLNHRILNTDDQGEVNMQLGSATYELKTWLPSGKNTDIIVGLQGAIRNNHNNEAHTRVLPNYSENEFALMSLYQLRLFEKLSFQAGLRYDFRKLYIPEQEKASHSHEKAEAEENNGEFEMMPELEFNYKNASISIGATCEIAQELFLRANFASAFRPPNVAELTQNGIHGVRFEKGNVNLESQRNYEGDLSLHYHVGNFSADVAGFYNHIFNYIYLSPTNLFENEYRVYQYNQSDANLYGSEINLRYHPLKWMELNGQFSSARGVLSNENNLPFIPHDKLKLEIKVDRETLGKMQHPYLKLQVVNAFAQNRPSEFETVTSAYHLINAGAGLNLNIGKQKLIASLNANNLFNTVYFDHLSTLKEIGYYNPGRNVALNLQWKF